MLGDTQWLWLLVLVGGPLILGFLLLSGVRQTEKRRREDPAGIARTEEATHRLYEEEEHRGEARPADDEDRQRNEAARRRTSGGRS